MTAADVLIETFIDWGVEVVFGLPGDGINGIMEALRTRQDKIRFVQVRHEEAAAFMACGYAKYTGKLGVCLATSGPGGIHLLNGLYDAKLDGQPVLAITGMQFHDLIDTHHPAGRRARQAVHGRRRLSTSASWAPTHVENVADLACRTALGVPRRRPHHLPGRPPGAGSHEEASARSATSPHHTSDVLCARSARPSRRGRSAPGGRDPERGKKVAILAGRGALDADRRTGADSPKCSARRSSRRCSARPPCPTTAPTPPAASACSAPRPRRRRWRIATRC